jgi:ribosomal protein S11
MRHRRRETSPSRALFLCSFIISCLLTGCGTTPSVQTTPNGHATPPRLVPGEIGYEEQAVRAVLDHSPVTQVQVFWTEQVQVPNAPGVSTPAALSALLVMPAATTNAALDTTLWQTWNVLASSYGSVPINVAIWTADGTDLADLWYRASTPELTGWTRGQIWHIPVSAHNPLATLTIAGQTGVAASLSPRAPASATQLAQQIVTLTAAFGTKQVDVSLQYGLALLQLPANSPTESVYHALQAAIIQIERARPVTPQQPFTLVAVSTTPDLTTFNPASANLGQAVLASVSGHATEVTIVAGDVTMKALLKANGTGI